MRILIIQLWGLIAGFLSACRWGTHPFRNTPWLSSSTFMKDYQSVIYCYITKLVAENNKHYLSVSVDQDCKQSTAWCLWLSLLWSCTQAVAWCQALITRLDWLLAGLRRSTFKLPPRELTIGLPHDMAAGFTQGEPLKRVREPPRWKWQPSITSSQEGHLITFIFSWLEQSQ